ncbi:MAG: hypothetical protein QMD46_06690 [Methanomicrobiales archaeon]|nr:hypothetical protein [Methanomicrobiales archaeon]MDI6876350.1 hypothetical protein [Methanomicrobiales archaeon]
MTAKDAIALLLRVLGGYPDVQQKDLDALKAYPETKGIAEALSSGNAEDLTAGDFERVADDGTFLFTVGAAILNYGIERRNRPFLELGTDLLARSREHLEPGLEYARSLAAEGSGRVTLAELGVDPRRNLLSAASLNERARKEGFPEKTEEYALALLNEAIVRNILADMDVNSLENFRCAAELSERARNEGLIQNSAHYARALMNEANARQMIAGLGFDEEANFNRAVELYRRAREEGLQPDAPEYPRSLIAEADTLVRMADLCLDPAENIRRAQELYQAAEKHESLTDGERAKIYRMLQLKVPEGASAR